MASDDYTAVGGGGALKLKGSKVHKKKKKRDKKTDLEKNLDTGKREGPDPDKKKEADDEPRDEEDDRPEAQKTEAEKRHDEIKKKRVSSLSPTCITFLLTWSIRSSSSSPSLQALDPNFSRRTRNASKSSTPTFPD